MKTIFKTYTGSAFLNNALQTIEVLAGLDEVSEITTDTLLELYKKHKIWELFKRMKSYSMLFSRNGPLLNDKSFGDKIYKGIFEYTLNNFEMEGQYQCEISGLRFDTSFSKIYEKVLFEIKYPVKKIKGKDKTINRCWFPLTGALGSDAQALPQARFDIQIHPICLAIIQFLPFSAVLYKGSVLLIDSMNFEFTKSFIKKHVNSVLERKELKNTTDKIENVRFTKGDYIISAINLYSRKKGFIYEDDYTDLNLWSFSNSGTGASCEIDRIPNAVFKKLYVLGSKSATSKDFEKLIQIPTSPRYPSLIDCLTEQKDYWALYPRIRKKKLNQGVNVAFYDAFQKLIERDTLSNYAKYIAFLISQSSDLKAEEMEVFKNTEAHTNSNYQALFFKVLLEATKKGKWTLQNHLEILNPTEDTIIRAWTSRIHKMVNFYYYNNVFVEDCPIPKSSDLHKIMSSLIHLIEEDERNSSSDKRLKNNQKYESYNINQVLVRNRTDIAKIDLEAILNFTYQEYKPRRKDLNKLLRVYFNQPTANNDFQEEYLLQFEVKNKDNTLNIYRNFVKSFNDYYKLKKGLQDNKDSLKQYRLHVLDRFPNDTNSFRHWISDVLKNMKIHYEEQKRKEPNSNFNFQAIENYKENLFYDPNGEYNLSFSRFAVQFLLNQEFPNLFTNE